MATLTLSGFLTTIFTGRTLALLGAALAMALAGTGSAKGTGIAGEAGAGILSESPEKFVRVLTLQALPGTQGIYGMIIAFMILFADGVIPGTITLAQGCGYFCAALPIAIGGYFSAIAQGRVSAAAMGIVASKPEKFTNGVVLAGVVETYAVFSLIVSILIFFNV